MARFNKFAHLMGLARAEEDEDKKQRPDESDEDYAKRMEEDKKDDKEDESDGKKAEEDEDEKKSKKSKKAEDGDEDKDEEKKDNKEAAIRSERARCAAIFRSEGAGSRPDVAAHLAFETSMPAAEAVALLASVASGAPKSARDRLAERMSSVKTPNVGVDGGVTADPSSPAAVAAAIVAAGKRRRGEA